MSEDDFRDLSSEPDTSNEELNLGRVDEDETDTSAEESEDLGVQAVPPQEFDQPEGPFTPIGEGGEVADDSNKDGAPATVRETGTVSEDFEKAIKGRVEQFDQEEVAKNSGPRPVGLPEDHQITVVEPQADQSGYVVDRVEHNAQPYVVQEDSVLSGHPWYVQAGTVQGRSQNPPLTDDLAKELGVDNLT